MIRFEEGDLEKELVPPAALWAIAALLVTVLIIAFVARMTGVGVVTLAGSTGADVEPVVERMISFGVEDRAGGGEIPILDGRTGEVLVVLPPGEGGFLRGAVRPLTRERTIRSADPSEPYRLTRWSDGRLTLMDPVSEIQMDLGAFGPDNAAAFAALLPRGETSAETASTSTAEEGKE
jgi:putative photosynthetic complex assembly protein